MNYIINKINELKVLEIMIKEEEQIISYDSTRLDKFIKIKDIYNKMIIDFFKEDNLKNLLNTEYSNANDLNNIILIIDYIETLPLKVNQDFIKEVIKLDYKIIENNYPNFYYLMDNEYLFKIKNNFINCKNRMFLNTRKY